MSATTRSASLEFLEVSTLRPSLYRRTDLKQSCVEARSSAREGRECVVTYQYILLITTEALKVPVAHPALSCNSSL